MRQATPRPLTAMFCITLMICVFAFAPLCAGYSVLTHEEIIDLLWDQQIQPLLLARFPDASPQDLVKAHAYAYGGSVVQDIGYYPFGNHVFSDLTHYVRTGDFVLAMLSDAQDLDEYAFALGALSHYISDINGHPYINLSVGIAYPALARQYGPAVPFDVDHKAHLKTEFGFDILQIAKGRYAPENYHNFIGFEVSASLLERAFYDTYGLKLTDVMPNEQLAIGTYRRSISQILPEMTKVALLVKGDELQHEIPNFNRQHFLYHLSKADYNKSWGSGYQNPGPGAHFLAVLFKVAPKVGRSAPWTSSSRRPKPRTSISRAWTRRLIASARPSAKSRITICKPPTSISTRVKRPSAANILWPTRPTASCSTIWPTTISTTWTMRCGITSWSFMRGSVSPSPVRVLTNASFNAGEKPGSN